MRFNEEKMKDVLSFICDCYEKHGYSPTIREICDGARVKSTCTVYGYINKLVEQGALVKDGRKSRTVRPANMNVQPGLIKKDDALSRVDEMVEIIQASGEPERVKEFGRLSLLAVRELVAAISEV